MERMWKVPFRAWLFLAVLPLSEFTQAQWQSLNGGVNEFVRCFALSPDSTSLLLGGSFRHARNNGDSIGVFGLVRWNGSQWDTTGLATPDPIAMIGKLRYVTSLMEQNDTILVSGVGCLPDWECDTMSLGTRLVAGGWQPFGQPDYGMDLFRLNGRIFTGGDNTDSIFDQPVHGVGEYRNGTVQALPNSPFSTPDIYGAAYWHGVYYFVGNTGGELGSPDIVAYDGVSTWSGVGGGMGTGWLRAAAGLGDSLYVGGYFFPGGNNLSTHAQIFDGTAWQPFFPQVEFIGQVWDIQTYQGAVYISGIYNFVGESTWYGLLRYDGQHLCAIGGPMPSGAQGKIAFFQNNLYMPQYSLYPGGDLEWVGYLPLDGLVPDTCITISQSSMQERERAMLKVSPNPAEDQLTVQWSAGGLIQSIEVYDLTGRKVLEQVSVNAGVSIISIRELAPGMYTVSVRSGSGGSSARFIKR